MRSVCFCGEVFPDGVGACLQDGGCTLRGGFGWLTGRGSGGIPYSSQQLTVAAIIYGTMFGERGEAEYPL